MAGIMAIDDAIDVVTGLMCDIAGSIKSEQRQEGAPERGEWVHVFQ
jgi:hypothetical protein